MEQEPTQGQTFQADGASNPPETIAPEKRATNIGQKSSGGFFTKLLGMLRTALRAIIGGATAPGTKNPEAQTTRSQAGWLKNFLMKLVGKGKPLYGPARSLRNTPWERKRGNDYSQTYDSDGRLSLTLRDGVLSERALQMLAALDASETKELDPSSAGIGKLPNVGKMMQHSADKEMCDKLLELRKRLQENGGSLEVVPSSDGFGKVLKITIDTKNKTVEQVQKEISDVFSTLGIGSPQMAESIAKELLRTRDSQKSAQDEGVSSTHTDIKREARASTVAQDLSMTGTPEHSSRNAGASGPRVANSRRSSADMSAAISTNGIESVNFSLSGDTRAIPSSNGQDYSVLQGQFLSAQSAATDRGAPVTGSPSAPVLDPAALRDAAEGMDMVSGVSSVNLADTVMTPAVTSPEAASTQSKAPTRGV